MHGTLPPLPLYVYIPWCIDTGQFGLERGSAAASGQFLTVRGCCTTFLCTTLLLFHSWRSRGPCFSSDGHRDWRSSPIALMKKLPPFAGCRFLNWRSNCIPWCKWRQRGSAAVDPLLRNDGCWCYGCYHWGQLCFLCLKYGRERHCLSVWTFRKQVC